MSRCLCLVFAAAALSAFLSHRAVAQQMPSVSVGMDPKATYSSSDVDSVDMLTGRVDLHIPLLTDHSQRGSLNFSYSVVWSGFADWYPSCYGASCYWTPSAFSSSPVSGPVPILDSGLGGPLTYAGGVPSGGNPCLAAREAGVGTHPFASMQGVSGACTPGDTTPLESVDASGIQYKGNGTQSILTNSSGIQFQNAIAGDSTVSSIEDPNGNVITTAIPAGGQPVDFGDDLFAGDSLIGSGMLWTMTDTVNRAWELDYSNSDTVGFGSCAAGTTNAYTWKTPGVSGGTRVFTFCYSPVNLNTDFPPSIAENLDGALPMLTQVILPDGTSYTFHYDDGDGDLTELDLPTGGKITYTYITKFDPCNNAGQGYLKTLATRTVSDGHISQLWTYSLYYGVMTVTDPLGDTTVYTDPSQSCEPITTAAYKNSGGDLLKTVTSIYEPYTPAPLSWNNLLFVPIGSTTAWGTSGPSTTTEHNLDTGFKYQYGSQVYGAPYGPQTSTVQYGYDSQPMSLSETSYKAFDDPNYLAANILTAPDEVTEYHPVTDNVCSDTQYTYDEAAYMVGSGIGAGGQHLSPPNPSALGNVTSVIQHAYGTACQDRTTIDTLWTTHRYVYDTGMLQKSVDPAGNATTYAYSSTYVGAYPTAVTNALGQALGYTYDLNTGLPLTSTDLNARQTAYSYDNMLRTSEVDYPDGGQETWTPSYSGGAYVGSAYTKKIDALNTYSETILTDGLGRTTRTQVADPQGADITDTTYDGLGRVASVSNPYRSTTDPTYSFTSYAYDGVGRMTLECGQDNGNGNGPCVPGASYKRWTYTGNVTDSYDESGVHTQQTADADGRITKVLEADDSGTLDVETNYVYDQLNNLTSVVQHGTGSEAARTRTFAYDTLSRLISSTNPESGTTTYNYNLAGGGLCSGDPSNACTRTDARAIVTSYSYDALNRVAAKGYANDPTNTPSLTLTYDLPTAYPYQGDFVGHVSGMTTWLGTTPWLNWVSADYDQMGRYEGYTECSLVSGLSCGGNPFIQVTPDWDLAGNNSDVASDICYTCYPDEGEGGAAFYNRDRANHLISIVTYMGVGTAPEQVTTLFNAATYNALGELTGAALAVDPTSGTAAMTVARAYDVRGRITAETDAKTGGGEHLQLLAGGGIRSERKRHRSQRFGDGELELRLQFQESTSLGFGLSRDIFRAEPKLDV